MGVCAHGGFEVCRRECLCKKEVEAELGKEAEPATTPLASAVQSEVA